MIPCHFVSVISRENIVLLSLLDSLQKLLVHLSINRLRIRFLNSSEHWLIVPQQDSIIDFTNKA